MALALATSNTLRLEKGVLQRPKFNTRACSVKLICSQDGLGTLLEKAYKKTFEHEPGQLYGRAGRRCTLEDGERILDRCISLYPESLEARLMMAHNLTRQNRGREQEVPDVALQALTLAHKQSIGEAGSKDAEAALELIKLAIEAYRKGNKDAETMGAFVHDAKLLVPELSRDIDALAH
eukprot:jgi/Botrbrau1/3576/Bobra.0078s0031.1